MLYYALPTRSPNLAGIISVMALYLFMLFKCVASVPWWAPPILSPIAKMVTSPSATLAEVVPSSPLDTQSLISTPSRRLLRSFSLPRRRLTLFLAASLSTSTTLYTSTQNEAPTATGSGSFNWLTDPYIIGSGTWLTLCCSHPVLNCHSTNACALAGGRYYEFLVSRVWKRSLVTNKNLSIIHMGPYLSPISLASVRLRSDGFVQAMFHVGKSYGKLKLRLG